MRQPSVLRRAVEEDLWTARQSTQGIGDAFATMAATPPAGAGTPLDTPVATPFSSAG
jgi:hypothetical protein